jgi:pimeloyl-ACP methyl ester carboxylesterase
MRRSARLLAQPPRRPQPQQQQQQQQQQSSSSSVTQGGVSKNKKQLRAAKNQKWDRTATTLEKLGLCIAAEPAELGTSGRLVLQQQQYEPNSFQAFEFVSQEHYEFVGRLVLSEIRARMAAPPLSFERFALLPSPFAENKEEEDAEEPGDQEEKGGRLVRAPLDINTSDPSLPVLHSEVFCSPGLLLPNRPSQPETGQASSSSVNKTLLVLVPGAGVMAGQWSRALCVNDSLDTGSMLPFLTQAQTLSLPVLVLNPNCTSIDTHDPFLQGDPLSRLAIEVGVSDESELPRRVPIPTLDNPFLHVQRAFEDAILASGAEEIVVVAHSFGGTLTASLISDNEDVLLFGDELRSGASPNRPRLRGVAFTDSVHTKNSRWSPRVAGFLGSNRVCNWVRSKRPLGESLKAKAGVRCVSSGTDEHERTSECARGEIFPFLESCLSGHGGGAL